VAISNERIAGVHNGEVAFRVRVNGAAGKKRTIRLDGAAFIGRFLLHLLPKGFKRIRHYGLLGPAHKATHLAAARAALHAPQPEPMVIESVAQFMRRVARIEWAACPHCQGGHFEVLAPALDGWSKNGASCTNQNCLKTGHALRQGNP